MTMKMIFISNNNFIQKFLFNNLGNMGKQEVIDLFMLWSHKVARPATHTLRPILLSFRVASLRQA